MAILLAVALHAAFGVALLSRPEAPRPPDVAMDVVLAPPWRPPPPADAPVKVPPLRPARSGPRARANAPVAAPLAKAVPAAAWRVRPPAAGEDEAARRTLRTGVGCRSADFLGLTKAERQACDEKLAKGAKDAPLYAVVSPELQKQFDGVFECPKDDVWCEYRIGKAPYPGLFAPHGRRRKDWD